MNKVDNNTPVGAVIFQPPYYGNPIDLITSLRSPQYTHCGIYTGQGKMIAAIGSGISYQDAGAVGNIYVVPKQGLIPVGGLEAFLGKPYDFIGLLTALIPDLRWPQGVSYTCSAFIAYVLHKIYGTPSYRQITPHQVLEIIT